MKNLPAEPPLPPPGELFDCLEDVVAWVKDREGRYTWVNRAFLVSYSSDVPESGADPRRVLGKTDYDLSPPFLADQFRLDDEHVLSGNRIVNRIELVGAAEGEACWHVTNKVPVSDAKGRIVGTAGITRPLRAPDAAAGDGFGPVLTYIRDHYLEAIGNRELARRAHMSVRAFERRFLAQFHVSPQKYLRKLRLRLASRELVYTEARMAEVALRCGFADQSHFTREFRRHYGVTPREYRERYRR
jgi:AraC-like DNA-binding protein